MKNSFFRWAVGFGSILGAALTTMPTPADAAATRGMNITLFARDDIGPLVGVALVDAGGVDRSDTCGRGAQINPDYDDWACLALPDGDYELRVTAPADVTVAIRCSFAALPDVPLTHVRTVALPQTGGVAICIVWAWPAADNYPPAALAVVYAQAPAALLADTTLVLTDAGGDSVANCTSYPQSNAIACEPLATGSYLAELAGGPAGVRRHLTCSTTSSDPHELFGWRTVDEIVISPGTLRVDCNLLAATPTIEISTLGVPAAAQFSMVADSTSTATPCTHVGTTVSCASLPPGTYHLVTDTPLPLGVPQGWGCTDWGPGRTTVSAWPATFTIADDATLIWFACSLDTGTITPPTTTPTPTTIGGPHDSGAPSDTTGSEGPLPTTTAAPRGLPSTGGSVPMVPLALVLLGLGAAASLLARRPVR